jgi:hypothetical protein
MALWHHSGRPCAKASVHYRVASMTWFGGAHSEATQRKSNCAHTCQRQSCKSLAGSLATRLPAEKSRVANSTGSRISTSLR